MTIKITIDLWEEGDKAKQLEDAMAALGFRRDFKMNQTRPAPVGGETSDAAANKTASQTGMAEALRDTMAAMEAQREADLPRVEELPESDPEGLFTMTDAPVTAAAAQGVPYTNDGVTNSIESQQRASITAPARVPGPTRVPGQPSPGRKRRTKEDMAEDEALALAAGKELAALPFRPASDDKPAISTGEPRVDPATAAQDKADEKAEAAAARKNGKLTHDDIREAVAEFTAIVGIPAAQKEVPDILGCAIVAVPDTQEALSRAVETIHMATQVAGREKFAAENHPVIEVAGSLFAEPEPPKAKTLAEQIAEALKEDDVRATFDDVVDACKAYARKYDGQDADLSKAKNMQVDIPQVLEKVLGVRTVVAIPKDAKSYGRALTVINLAYTADPFGRGKKE